MKPRSFRVYCGFCKSLRSSKVVPFAGEKFCSRALDASQNVAWIRRKKKCVRCGAERVTAEIDEASLLELIERRERSIRFMVAVNQLSRKRPWLDGGTISEAEARAFIRSSAWWHTHSSGKPVKAPGHETRIKRNDYGWVIDFGANSFLIEQAMKRCSVFLLDYVAELQMGNKPSLVELRRNLEKTISGAVANHSGFEYATYYPLVEGHMIFGAQSLSATDASAFMIHSSGILTLPSV